LLEIAKEFRLSHHVARSTVDYIETEWSVRLQLKTRASSAEPTGRRTAMRRTTTSRTAAVGKDDGTARWRTLSFLATGLALIAWCLLPL
jgi:hypothetical protein